ncbi:MAG: sigma-70 family RNA polymerase sigma factor [Planctomycetaceae bacterium]|nr:sigma-70 family RNA polymerase sigma factor [Planctomycetaceae bacterium]MBN8602662.1 sigma-70 family RNA polymerase sigma factor [Planctomycetota bacterium]
MSDSTAELVSEGRALVRSIAIRIFRNIPVRVDLDDLIAYGELGLMEAARDFDEEKGAQFTTFAYYRIQGAIYDGLAKMTWTSRARLRRIKYERAANAVMMQDADANSNKALGEEASGEWFAKTAQKLSTVYMMSEMDDSEGGSYDFEDPNGDVTGPVFHKEASDQLRKAVEKLPYAEKRLISLVYFEGYTLQDAGEQLGYSKSWTSRLHARILETLSRDLQKLGISHL